MKASSGLFLPAAVFAAAICVAHDANASSAVGILPDEDSAVVYNISPRETFYDVWINERLAVGMSLTYIDLLSTERPEDYSRTSTFIGYVNHEDVKNEISWAPTVSWLASDYVRLGLTYAQAEASTLNFNNHLGDGIVSFKGVVFSVEGTYPLLDGKVRPHAGLGLGYYSGDFEEYDWWHLGYSSPEAWADAGYTTKTPGGHYREISVDDAASIAFIAGVAWRPIEHFELDLSLRWSQLKSDCSFDFVYEHKVVHQLDGEFDLENLTVALTASYVF